MKAHYRLLFLGSIACFFVKINANELSDKLNALSSSLHELSNVITKIPVQKVAFERQKVSDPKITDLENKRVAFDPFEHVMGFKENYQNFAEQISTPETGPFRLFETRLQVNKLLNQTTNNPFIAGKFEQLSIEKLRTDFQEPKIGSGSKFHVIEALEVSEATWYRYLFDMGALQANPENKDAVFQVGSHFNALGATGDPKQGLKSYLAPEYYQQGEAAAISAMPGAIFRLYFGVKDAQGHLLSQNFKQINFLEKIDNIIVTNGQPFLSIGLETFQNLTDKQMDQYVKKINIGFHKDIQVTSGLGPLKTELDGTEKNFKAIKIQDQSQQINQAYVGVVKVEIKNAAYETFAQIALRAAYEGTLKAAYAKNKKKIFLTLVGAGKFKNELAWMQVAIERALHGFETTGDLDIYLLVHDISGYNAQEVEAFRKAMLSLTNKMGGRYIQYDKDGIYELKAQ